MICGGVERLIRNSNGFVASQWDAGRAKTRKIDLDRLPQILGCLSKKPFQQGETRFSTTSPIAENIHRQPTRLLVSAPSLVKINYFAERLIAQKTATTGGTPNTMRQSKAFLIMSLAVIIGCGSLIVSSVAVSGDDLVYLCYRNKTIQVPFYLKPRYTSKGALNGPCPTSPP